MNDLVNIDDTYKMSPEILEVTNVYLQTNSVTETAEQLSIPREKVTYYIGRPESKRYIDNIFLDQGYLNRGKLMDAMSGIIDKKLEELEEAELGSNKDIADLLMMMHKMRKDYEDFTKPTATQTKIEVNGNAGFGTNYNELLSKIAGGE